MDFEKMWRTLKAESGYRNTHPCNLSGVDEQTIKELMDSMEKRKQFDKMIEYKKQALERFNLDERYSRFFKKCRKAHFCDKCKKPIKVGDIYLCNEGVSSYFVDYFGSYHLDCVSRDEIIDLIRIETQHI